MATTSNDPMIIWPNLASNNLMAQLNITSKGVPTLLIRPLDLNESPELVARRAKALDDLLQSIAQKVGNPKRLTVRLVGNQINAAAGQMIDTPQKMAAFLNKAFPKAGLMNLRLSEIRQEESIRQAAMAIKEADQVKADSPFHLDALNKALPAGLIYRQVNGQLSLEYQDIPENPVHRSPWFPEATNQDMVKVVSEGLRLVWDADVDGMDDRQARLADLRAAQDQQNTAFWVTTLNQLESRLHSERLTVFEQETQALLVEQPENAESLERVLGALSERVNQRRDLKNRIEQRIAELEKRKPELTGSAEVAVPGDGDSVLDNVQDNEGSEVEVAVALGVNRKGWEVFENAAGARFAVVDGQPVFESEGPVEGQGRSEDWLTLEESLGLEVSLESRLRAQFVGTVAPADQARWQGLTLVYEGNRTPVMVRALRGVGSEAELQVLTLEVDGPEPRVQLLRLSAQNKLLKEGGQVPAGERVLKNWAELGLPLPGTQGLDGHSGPDGDTVEGKSSTEDINHDTDEPSVTGGVSRDGTRTDPDAAPDPDRAGEPAAAGGRGGIDADRTDGVSGTDGDRVPDAVAGGLRTGGAAGRQTGQSGEPGGVPDSEGPAGDLESAGVDAGSTVRGSDGLGDGGARRLRTDGGADENDQPTESGQRASDGRDAVVPGEPSGSPEAPVAPAANTDRRAGGPDRPGAGVSDATDGESEPAEPTVSGAVSGEPGGDRGRPDSAGSGSAGADARSASGDIEDRDGRPEDSDPRPREDGGDLGTGETDWADFAEQSSASGDEKPEPLVGDLALEQRTPAVRLADNLEALRTLVQLTSDPDVPAKPTLEERQILAKFSGFGGIHPRMFQRYHAHGVPNYVIEGTRALEGMIRDGALTSSEYDYIKSTTLNAHYTHSGLIGPMWEALDRMNLPLGRVLEPSCGIGNFKAFMPEQVASKVTSFTGVEIDPLTARLATLAHPDARIVNSGFEKTTFPDGFFDTVISNVPFGDYKVFDPEHPERKDTIHNAFFLKALDKVRPGGVVAFITSAYVMDADNDKVRREIMRRSHVMGAFRLPNGTFKQTTGTEVVTDVLFLQKKGNFEPNYTPLDITSVDRTQAPLATASPMDILGEEVQPGEMVGGFKINSLYLNEPDRVLGDLQVVSGPHGPTLIVAGGGSVEEQRLRATEAFALLPQNVTDDVRQTVTADDIEQMLAHHQAQARPLAEIPGALSVAENEIRVVELNELGVPVPVPEKTIPKNMQKRAIAAILTMTALSDLLEAEAANQESDEQLNRRRAEVSELLTGWEKLEQATKAKLSATVWKALNRDPRAQRIQFESLYNKADRSITRPDILNGRTIRPMNERPTSATTLEDALGLSLAYTATISESYILDLLKSERPELTLSEIRKELLSRGFAFIDPVSGDLVERTVYLSGNLRPKIEAAENILDAAPEFQANLDALNAALPAPLSASQIKVSIDAFWLPEHTVRDFLSTVLDIPTTGNTGVRPYYDAFKHHWRLEPIGGQSMANLARIHDHIMTTRWGTKRKSALDLLDHLFTSTQPVVKDKVSTDPDRWVINAEETLKAQAKFEEIKDAFDRWVFKDPARAQELVDIYNHRFNATVLHDPDGSHMVYPGMAEHWVPRKHQNDFIWRAVSGKNSMTAHVVGAGKTLQLIGTAVRGKQMGRWNKPLVVVPNHMLEQFANDGQGIYPNAKILVMSAADARAANRAGFAAKMAMGDWDMIVCTHSVFEKITVPREFEMLTIERELAKLRTTLEDEKAQKRPKEIEKEIKKLEEKLERHMEAMRKDADDNALNLKDIGVDFIGVDEAHYYKNLMLDTTRQIPGVSNSASSRAWNLYMKCQFLREHHGDCYGVMMATGTPISNSMTELYTFTRMLRPDILEEAGIGNFNDWMGLFGEVQHGMEIKPEGGGYHIKSRLSKFKNIPELVKQIRTFIDFKTAEDLNLPTPEVEFEVTKSEPSDFAKLFMKYIEARAKSVRRAKNETPEIGEAIAMEIREALQGANDKTLLKANQEEIDEDAVPEMPNDILLTIATDGRKFAVDPRMIHPKFEDTPSSKVAKAAKNMLALYRKYDDEKALQLMFCDFSSPTGKGIYNVYRDLKDKLIAGGVPEDQIAFIHDAKTDADKEAMFTKARSGDIRFLFGSTQKMGVGTNVQERCIAVHTIDPPWRPADLSQQLGRLVRQGNSFDNVYAFRYVAVDSFDLFMYSTLDRKLKLVNQALRKPEEAEREINEETEPSYEDIMAEATGNQAVKEFMEVRQKHGKYKRMLDSHTDAQADIGGRILKEKSTIDRLNQHLEAKTKEQDIVKANQPMALTIDTAIPKLCDGPMAVVGGLKNLAAALETLSRNAPRYQTHTIGTFGGLDIKVERMGSGPTILVQRLTGKDERLITISDQAGLNGPGFQQSTAEADSEVDEYYQGAKALVRYVRKIGTDNGIAETQQVLANCRRNLKALEADHGAPFPYEAELKSLKERLEILTAEVGDSLDEDKPIDPIPLIRFAEAIHEQTGEHAELVATCKSMVPGFTLHVNPTMLEDSVDTDEEDEETVAFRIDEPAVGDDMAPEHT